MDELLQTYLIFGGHLIFSQFVGTVHINLHAHAEYEVCNSKMAELLHSYVIFDDHFVAGVHFFSKCFIFLYNLLGQAI